MQRILDKGDQDEATEPSLSRDLFLFSFSFISFCREKGDPCAAYHAGRVGIRPIMEKAPTEVVSLERTGARIGVVIRSLDWRKHAESGAIRRIHSLVIFAQDLSCAEMKDVRLLG